MRGGHAVCVPLSVDGHLGSFHLEAVVYPAAANTVSRFLCGHGFLFLLGGHPGVGPLGQRDTPRFTFFEEPPDRLPERPPPRAPPALGGLRGPLSSPGSVSPEQCSRPLCALPATVRAGRDRQTAFMTIGWRDDRVSHGPGAALVFSSVP